MNARQARIIGLGLAAVVAIAAIFALSRLLRDDGASDASFFAEATGVSCNGNAVGVTVEDARFTAFSGDLRAGGSEKLTLVDIHVADARTDDALAGSFRLTEPGESVPPERVLARQERQHTLIFRVPKESGAFKLIFDDGCAREEWLIP